MKNLCVIGYGVMGRWHAEQAKNSDAVRLAGVYDISEKMCAQACADGIDVYESLEAVFADENVDIVTIATRNETHKEYVIRALEAGKHVICEKPVALNSTDLQEMIDVALRCERVFTVHQNRRWNVDFLKMKELIDSGELGKIYSVESRIHGSRGIPSGWRGKKEFGGGMLYDWGVHLIDQMLKLIPKKIVRISCIFDHITVEEVDDGFKLTLFYENGSTAYIEVGTYNLISLPRIYLRAEKGTAMITDWKEKCKFVRLNAWSEADVLPHLKSEEVPMTMAPRDAVTTDAFELEIPTADAHDFYRNVCAAADGKEAAYVSHADMLRVLRVIETAFEAAARQNAVECFI